MEEQRQGTLDLCVVLHELGPGSRWAARCAVGDRVVISRSRTIPIALDRSVEAHLFLGDETSIAAADALIKTLPAKAIVLACFEVASMNHRWPKCEVARPEEIHWVDRVGRPGSALVSWLARQELPFANSTTAYVTGEAWLCALVHAHLVRERGFPARAVRASRTGRPSLKRRDRAAAAARIRACWMQTLSLAAQRVQVWMSAVGASLLGEHPDAVPILRQRLG